MSTILSLQSKNHVLASPSPQSKNHILASLPPEEYERLAPHLEQGELKHGEILQESGGLINYVYFPERSMISLISQTPEGESVEVGVVGFEGMSSISAVLGVDRSSHELLVQVPDHAMR